MVSAFEVYLMEVEEEGEVMEEEGEGGEEGGCWCKGRRKEGEREVGEEGERRGERRGGEEVGDGGEEGRRKKGRRRRRRRRRHVQVSLMNGHLPSLSEPAPWQQRAARPDPGPCALVVTRPRAPGAPLPPAPRQAPRRAAAA